MYIAQAGSICSFEVTFDPGLFVAMTIYNDSGASPAVVIGPTAMLNVVGGMYRGKFTPNANTNYLVYKAVYTDGTFTTLSPDYNTGSESFRAIDFATETDTLDILNNTIAIMAKTDNLPALPASQSVVKNQALDGFQFIMTDNINHVPIPGLTVIAKRSIDGGAFATCANAVVEIGLGWYYIDLAASDLNGDSIGLSLTAVGADETAATITTEA